MGAFWNKGVYIIGAFIGKRRLVNKTRLLERKGAVTPITWALIENVKCYVRYAAGLMGSFDLGMV